jgi:hypothetical protein
MGYLNCHTPDFSHQNYIWISNNPEINTARPVTCGNMKYMCIYFAVRHCVAATWINDRDQFLYPRDGWQQDEEFGMDCLVFALFHGQNRFSAAGMTARSGAEQNHWLPFRASEVGAAAAYQSMAADMLQAAEHALSAKAQAVLAAGMELYKYYHQQSGALLLAGFYDIRLHFQGKNGSKMNHSSADQEYMHRIAALRAANKQLAASIELKVYQYGFLKN